MDLQGFQALGDFVDIVCVVATAVAVAYTVKVYCPSCFVSEVESGATGIACLRDHLAIDFGAHIVAVVPAQDEVEAKAGHYVLRIVEYLMSNSILYRRLWEVQAVVQNLLLLSRLVVLVDVETFSILREPVVEGAEALAVSDVAGLAVLISLEVLLRRRLEALRGNQISRTYPSTLPIVPSRGDRPYHHY